MARSISAFVVLLCAQLSFGQSTGFTVLVPPGEEGAVYSPFGFVGQVPFDEEVDLAKAGRLFVVTRNMLFREVTHTGAAPVGIIVKPKPFTWLVPKDSLQTFTLRDVQAPSTMNVALNMVGNMQMGNAVDFAAMSKAANEYLAEERLLSTAHDTRYELVPTYINTVYLNRVKGLRISDYSVVHTINWRLLDRRTDKEVFNKDVTGGHYIGIMKVLGGGTERISENRQEESYAARKAYVSSLQCLLSDSTFLGTLRKGPPTALMGASEEWRLTDPEAAFPKTLQQCLPSVVTVRSGDTFGSGFFISPDAHLLTNDHVLAAQDSTATLILNNGFTLKAKVLRRDPDADVALLKVEGAGVVPLRCAGASQETGTEVYAIGTPNSTNLSQTLTKGIISGTREIDGHPLIQTDVGINRGNSGGPLIDANGVVIGIVSAKLIGVGTEAIGFAIPIGDAFSALRIR